MSNDKWFAVQDNMPGAVALRVSGTVTVPGSNYSATLTPYEGPAFQDLILRLQLNVTSEGSIGLAVLTDKEVKFSIPGAPNYHSVAILMGDAVVAVIPVTPVH
ncbi:hypothetical protein [Pseudomonas cremoricolorata]|uniref:Uncharacterized protein n=1 Tax=Pseudomonas cremoricolorata TaxID=157783 RepID=A0A089WJN0_9PSED|nr:hypothetical protein [Pseudomonas cremoricolorata]AIR88806.1 hypothetical protein LK03_05780 [Pseudomonas cremoricolorata]